MSELVGKWVLVESIMIGGTVSCLPKLVTRVSGSRVYISDATTELVGEEWVLDGGFEPSGFKSKKSIRYAFNSFEECRDAGNECHHLHWSWWTEQKERMKSESIIAIQKNGGIKVN